MTRQQYVVTPFGVRLDHLSEDGERLYSEYLPECPLPDGATPAGRWRIGPVVQLVVSIATLALVVALR
jgi:hypothetical protein